VTTTSTSDAGLTPSTNYCYSVAAYNSAGASIQTSRLCVTTQPAVVSEALIGNFKFVYQIISIWTDRITLNTKSSSKTSEGTDIYTGYDADYPSVVLATGAWFPSLSKYVIVTVPQFSTPYIEKYVFSINADNTLSGCWRISSDYGSTWSNCYSFIIPASHKSSLGSWGMLMESQNDPIDINEVVEKKIAEVRKVQAQLTESSSSVDGDLVSKINELKAMIENHR